MAGQQVWRHLPVGKQQPPGWRIKRHRLCVEVGRHRQYRTVTKLPSRNHGLRPDRLGGQCVGSLQTWHDLPGAQINEAAVQCLTRRPE